MLLKRWLGIILLTIFGLTLIPTGKIFPVEEPLITIKDKAPSVNRTWQTVSLVHPGQFHDFNDLQDEIEHFHMVAPELIDLEVIGQSYQNRDITCLRITNEEYTEQKAKTLVVAHHHGREQISIEMALRFIVRLLNNYGVDSVLTNYVDTQEIYIIPSLNPDTLEYVINQENHWLRKNLRPYDNDDDGLFDEDPVEDVDGDGNISEFDVYTYDGGIPIYQYSYFEGIDNDDDGETNEDGVGYVDLNRNYPTGFGNPGSSPFPEDQTYHGPAPFSEPETDAFRQFALNHRFAMAYSLHSGINATYFPSFQGGTWVNPLLYTTIYNELDDLLPPWWNSDTDYATSSQAMIPQLEAGEFGLWQDWMYAERNTAVPICFELYRNASSVSGDSINVVVDNGITRIVEWTGIYGYFNPIEEYIDKLWTEIQPAFDYLLALTPHLGVSLQGVVTEGSSITVSVNVQCLSPRLSTIDPVDFITEGGTILHSAPTIGPTQIQTITTTFSLSEIGSSNMIRIGNNYTGYTSLSLLNAPLLPAPNLIPIIAGLTIGIVAVVIIIYLIRRSRKD